MQDTSPFEGQDIFPVLIETDQDRLVSVSDMTRLPDFQGKEKRREMNMGATLSFFMPLVTMLSCASGNRERPERVGCHGGGTRRYNYINTRNLMHLASRRSLFLATGLAKNFKKIDSQQNIFLQHEI